MITAAYASAMAAYNTRMNEQVYGAAGTLTDGQRRAPMGTFWTSIHGTLSHLLWADLMWMSRFAGGAKPDAPLRDSGSFMDDFETMCRQRSDLDRQISDWAATLTDAWLDQDLAWYSSAAGRDIRAPRSLLLAHMFNHQTHHRGQVHALLTRCGRSIGDTDLFLLVPLPAGPPGHRLPTS